jgi:hypothetical protein
MHIKSKAPNNKRMYTNVIIPTRPLPVNDFTPTSGPLPLFGAGDYGFVGVTMVIEVMFDSSC